MKAKINNGLIDITFRYDPSLVSRIRGLNGRQWVSKEKKWVAPVTEENISLLKKWGFEMFGLKKKKSVPLPFTEVPGLKKELYPFQKQGVAFLNKTRGRTLIGDEMGLGKTVQALAWLQLHPELRPAVIVVPASVKYNWEKEAREWIDVSGGVEVLSGTKPGFAELSSDIIIINYDIIAHWEHLLFNCKPQVLILDECHSIKNGKAKRTKSTLRLGRKIPHVVAISGTPIVNKPAEFYNILSLLAPKTYPNAYQFKARYCGQKKKVFKKWVVNSEGKKELITMRVNDFSGASHVEELHDLTSSIMIRRLKKEVIPELPDKIRAVVPLEIDNRKEYDRASSDFAEWMEENHPERVVEKAVPAGALAQVEILKQLSVEGKLKQSVSWIEDYLEESGGKLVVFATHKSTITSLMETLKKYKPVKIDGSVPLTERPGIVEKFQSDKRCRVFVGNIKAAGTGITLTASSATCFVEMGWSPGEHDQAEDRVHRIGQESDKVISYYLIGRSTIEEKIASLIDQKAKVLKQILDGEEVKVESLLKTLLQNQEEETE